MTRWILISKVTYNCNIGRGTYNLCLLKITHRSKQMNLFTLLVSSLLLLAVIRIYCFCFPKIFNLIHNFPQKKSKDLSYKT